MILALFLLAATPADLDVPIVRESLTGSHRRVVRPTSAPPREGIRREIRYHRPLEPFAYDYDVETGRLLQRTPLFFTAKPARVFDPNPVASLNDPSLRDQNDAATAVPEAAYENVEIDTLDGPHVRLVDIQVPSIPPPSASFFFNRADDGFEDVSAYVHIDRNQRYLQSLGYTGSRRIVPYAIEVDAHAANGTDNSFFIPSSSQPGRGTLYFGEGGTDDAEDADLIVHEYGHAILEWIAPGTFGGGFGSQARALSEGFGDYWAFSQHYAVRAASGRDPFCFADWDARCWTDAPSEGCGYEPDTDCLRRVDSTRTMDDYEESDASGVEHRNGSIWSSALREIFLTAGKRTTDILVIESLFDAPPQPTYAAMARRLIDVDRLLYAGANATTICNAMAARKILDAAACGATPRGELTHYQSPDRAVPIPENNPLGITSTLVIDERRFIERLFVRVDIEHPSRGDLRIDLVANNGMVIPLLPLSFERAADVHTLFGPIEELRGVPAFGTWQLRVSDNRARDAGTLLSWSLVFEFLGDAVDVRPHDTPSRMVPVVAHLYGANGTEFVSDLRLANPSEVAQSVILNFTRSGADGTRDFSTVRVHVPAGQTAVFDDVVSSAFHTLGSGSLEVIGDVKVLSRLYTRSPNGGTLAQYVRSVAGPLFGTAFDPIYVAPIQDGRSRVNVGITEVTGHSGKVFVHEPGIATRTVLLQPFSHVQFPTSAPIVSFTTDGVGIAPYLSQIDNTTGDAMFIPPYRDPGVRVLVMAPYSAVPPWRSDLWLASEQVTPALLVRAVSAGRPDILSMPFEVPPQGESRTYLDYAPRDIGAPGTIGVLTFTLVPGLYAGSRLTNGDTTQFVPFRSIFGLKTQHLFVENAGSYRTNIGVMCVVPVEAEVVVYDSAGAAVDRQVSALRGGIAQIPVTGTIANGRAVVRFLSGDGRAYSSIIDKRTGDGTFVEGQ